MDETKMILKVLEGAMAFDEGQGEGPVLGGLKLEDFALHAKHEVRFSDAMLREIEAHPTRLLLLRAFEKEYGTAKAPWLERILPWLTPKGVEALSFSLADTGGAPRPPAYPLLVERANALKQDSIIHMLLTPVLTRDGFLVCKPEFPDELKAAVISTKTRAELILVDATEGGELGHIVVSESAPYLKFKIRPEILSHPSWQDLQPGGPLPFAFVLRLEEESLVAMTMPPVPSPLRPRAVFQ